ncbi:NAD(P)/FAD-dependent oxidoreductase [Streptomyces sp. NPDC058459]|uniref:NAD(P)/FAD-dependent oxidoreductase n=1 Tax=Streptomyces sp. NPDC058459 TaxID=3346508 RepID=UPI00365A2573
MKRLDVLVLGAGFGGLTAAVRLAEEGHHVTCLSDELPGASWHNFGQLHSGAVYAPVLPEVAAACWKHRSRWSTLLQNSVATRTGIGLFQDAANAPRYVDMWKRLGIPVRPLTAGQVRDHGLLVTEPPAAGFLLPDLVVDVAALHTALHRKARKEGAVIEHIASARLVRRGSQAAVRTSSSELREADTVVLAAGHRTAQLLDLLGIEHPLAVSRLPYGVLPDCRRHIPLTYHLDGDLLAVSPQNHGLHVALPGRPDDRASDAAQHYRLAAALSRHWPQLPVEKLELRWGKVAEVQGQTPDPSVAVADLGGPATGWGRVGNLVVCLPGKWTTAWHGADLIAQAVARRG